MENFLNVIQEPKINVKSSISGILFWLTVQYHFYLYKLYIQQSKTKM